jgi:putative ABC transport system permease protein
LKSNAENDEEFAKKILKIDGVTSVTMNSVTQNQVDENLDNLKIIVALMIVSAALLVFVVLYNLNNINITERKRELATLKVLGFYKDELERYVYRENSILTFFGIIIGIAIGIVLHFFVMHSVETDTTMFGIQIKWYSFLISILLTAVFSAIVNILMSFKLKRIDMVESLKSIE